MENFQEHIRHILLCYFKKGKKATEAWEELSQVYGRNVIEKRHCQNWFARFCGGDFPVKDAHRSDRPSEFDDDKIKALVQANRHSTVLELATTLKVSDVWVLHELKEIHLI